MNENVKWHDEIFNSIDIHQPGWEKLLMESKVKIKTNQSEVQFTVVEKILQKFGLRVTDVSFTDYYGIVIGIEKL
ncbi:MAG: hypothetical protein HKM23_00310 [Nitrosopumilus sp.]|nr:hypothetical protein [Nitrosopumilus sp.]